MHTHRAFRRARRTKNPHTHRTQTQDTKRNLFPSTIQFSPSALEQPFCPGPRCFASENVYGFEYKKARVYWTARSLSCAETAAVNHKTSNCCSLREILTHQRWSQDDEVARFQRSQDDKVARFQSATTKSPTGRGAHATHEYT